MGDPDRPFFATAAKGTEGALRDELRELGLRRVRAERGGVRFGGRLDAGVRATIGSRIAQRVLLEVGHGPARDADSLYETARLVEWEAWLDDRHTFAVHAVGRTDGLDHTGFSALRVKDAIVDRLRERLGRRPDVDTRDPDLRVQVHLRRGEVGLSLDLSGEALHRRGWRVEGGSAPLKETLAAAVLRLGGYDPERPMLDPMCGSGTLAVEAVLIARRIAPNLGRPLGVHRWPLLDASEKEAIARVEAEAKAAVVPRAPAPVLARDFSKKAVAALRKNLAAAGLEADVEVELRDARHLEPLPDGCQLFMNPPYGERMAKKRLQLEGLVRELGEAYRALPPGHPLVVFSGMPGWEPTFGGRALSRQELFNGPLRCRLFVYGDRG